MSNCDDAFQEIQRLEAERRRIEKQLIDAREALDPENRVDPARTFVFQDRATGLPVEVAFDEMWDAVRRADSDSMQRWAMRALGDREKPVGREGQFQNLAQLVDRMGADDATKMASMVQALTGKWEEGNPRDWNAVTAINDKEAFAERLSNAMEEAGIRLEKDTISQGIVNNVAPFLSILNRQTKLQVFADVTRSTLESKVGLIRQQIQETGLPPSREIKQEFIDSAAKAIFANRSAALSRRVSGQLLQQLQNNPAAGAIAGRLFEEEILGEADKIFGPTAQDLISEDSVVGKLVEAAGRGVDGLEDLAQLELTLKVEGPDPFAKLDKDFKHNWRRQARAYYKDSQLFNLNTQFINNYLANKLVFIAEGYRKAFENGVYLRPVGTSFLRSMMPDDKTIQGVRIAAEAGFIAHDVIRQGWADSIREGYMNSNTPFAGNLDTLGSSGTIDIGEQYQIARAVLEEPFEPNPGLWPIQARDKMFVGAKLLGNHLIEKAGGPKLPIASSLQMMGAVDQRSGLRTYMTARANQLLIDTFNQDQVLRQDWTWADRRQWVEAQLENELYQATPTEQNIRDARTQFDLADELSDEEIASWLAANKAGAPVLTSPDQRKAYELSVYARMQGQPTGVAGAVDQFAMKARENPYVDGLFPYWRSPFNQTIWDFKQSRPPIVETARVIFGPNPTQEQIAKVTGGFYTWLGMIAMFGALDSDFGKLEGNGPLDPKQKAEWLAAGHKPNSVFGIPYNMGGLPILNTLFLFKDLKETFISGEYSDYDRYNGFWGLAQVAVGQLMRQTGWRQFQMLGDTLLSQDQKRWEQFLGFLANGQTNVLSGGMRQIERLTGTGRGDLMASRYDSPEDRYMRDRIADDDPLEQLHQRLRELATNYNPLIGFLLGQPLKEEDYLGRDVRRPDGIFRGEWPLGFPGLWKNPVYATLDRLGLLQPPAPLMSGRLDGVLMGEDLEKEFNHYNGNLKGSLLSEHPLFAAKAYWNAPAAKEGYVEDGVRVEEKYTQSVDLAPLLDRLTNGKTLYEAINGLLKSDAYKTWEKDPRFTTDPKINDRPRKAMLEQPGPRAIKLLHDYYAQLATEKVGLSPSEAAKQWREQRDAIQRQRTPLEVEKEAQAVEATIR
jgi:hypothetical protein